MSKDKMIAIAITAVIVLIVGPKLRSTVPGLNKLPTV